MLINESNPSLPAIATARQAKSTRRINQAHIINRASYCRQFTWESWSDGILQHLQVAQMLPLALH